MNHSRVSFFMVMLMLPLLGHARQVAYDYDADSQDSYKIYFPQFPYQSPEVYSFQRCHSVDVNEYIGCANVSIPLYTIKSHDIEIPISLSYHGGGIKVAEEASWVGLGWDLAVGGCISRVVVGNSNENISQVANRNTYRSFLSRQQSQTHGAGEHYQMQLDCTGLRRGEYVLHLNVNGQVTSSTVSL